MRHALTGAILAGGQSRRMGAPKAGVVLPGGDTLSSRVERALGAVCDEVVVLGHGVGCAPALPRIEDAPEAEGPLAGLLGLLRSGRAERYLVAACDMPLLSSALLFRLLEAAGEDEAACFLTEDPERGLSREPLPLLLPASALPLLEERVARGELRLVGFVDALRPRALRLPAEDVRALANVNRPEDLARLGPLDESSDHPEQA